MSELPLHPNMTGLQKQLAGVVREMIRRSQGAYSRQSEPFAKKYAGNLIRFDQRDGGVGVTAPNQFAETGSRCMTRLVARRGADGNHVELVGGCATYSWEVCLHQSVILRAVLLELEAKEPGEAVAAVANELRPPDPEDILKLIDKIVGKAVPKSTPLDFSVIWEVSVTYGTISVQPKMVPRLKKGGWGKERNLTAIHLQELKRLAPTPQDVAIAAELETLAAADRYGSLGSLLPTAVLLNRLAGHPEVYVGEEGPVKVESTPPTLSLEEVDSEFRVVLRLGDRLPKSAKVLDDSTDGLIGWWPDDKLIRVGLWKRGMRDLAESLTQDRIRVPASHAEAFANRLGTVERVMPVLLPESLRGRDVEPDQRLILQGEPLEPEGVKLLAMVRPLGAGPVLPAGEGDERVSALVRDERLTTLRKLSVEQRDAAAVFGRLGLGEGSEPRRTLASDEAVLDLLAKMQEPVNGDLKLEWPANKRFELSNQSVRDLRVHVHQGEDWFGVFGEAEVDGDTVALAALLAAAREGKKYVALGKGRFARLEKQFRDRLERLSDLVTDGREGLRMSSVAAPLAEEAFEGFEVVAPMAWRAVLERAKAARNTEPAIPKNLVAELRGYQAEGFRWLWRLSQMGVGGILADDMGLGKTVQAIAMLLERANGGPTLVVAPTSVGANWMRELERFAPSLRAIDFRESNRANVIDRLQPGDVLVASYGLVREHAEKLIAPRWHTLVFDEAQAFKNYETQTATIIRKLKADWRIALTGTPVENHLGELYSLMTTVCPGLLGTWRHFNDSFARAIERDRNVARRGALARVLRPFILRRTKKEVLPELPERTEQRMDVRLSKQERRLYEATRLATLAKLSEKGEEKKDNRFVVLAALTRLRQIASHARMVDPTAPRISSKLALLIEQLEEVVDEGHSALVFTQFASQIDMIAEVLSEHGIKSLTLDGSTPAKEREVRVAAFQRGEAPVFLISLKAGGTGLNLTAADYVFLLDPWWNPAVEDQAADRAHRIGQLRPVTIIRIVATGTVEEKVIAMHGRKRELVAGVLDGSDVAGKLSVDDLVDLLEEGRSAVYDEADETEVAANTG